MAFKLKYRDSDSLNVFLNDLEKSTIEMQRIVMDKAADIIKGNIQLNLEHLKTKNDNSMYKHMADDVRRNKIRDEYGNQQIRIRGGQKTGTLWHIVNDGTYRTRATNFMDLAMDYSDPQIENIVDQVMKEVGL